jgi:PAS domain S-box-containing protein
LRSLQDDLTVPSASSQGPDDERPLVLIADDNADMRQYVVRMLGAHYRTLAVPDGERALEAARERTPDLILTDVMMPRLDGFGLLQALRADARTSGLPVIMLSARAGEESRIEGLQEGADDYLVKQFSSRELLARVAALLQMVRMRRESSEAIRASEEQFRALVSASSDVVYRMNADWTEMRQLQGREFIADTREANRSWLQKYIQPCDQERVMATVREAVLMKGVFELEHQVLRIDGTLGWMFSRAIALLDNVGTVVEWLGTASDITARKQAQQALIESEEKYRSLFERMDEGYCVIEMIFDADNRPVDYRFLETNPAFEKHSGLRGVHGRRMREIVPDHDAYWFEIYGRVAVTGEAIRFVNEAMAMDGRWFDVYAFRLGGKESHRVAVLFNDISNRKGSEDALRASEDRSRTILESITDGFFAIDGDWRFTYVNAAGERILGRAQSDLIGKRLWDEYPGAVGSEFERVYRRVACGQGRESFTAYYPDSDRWYEVTAYPAPVGISVYFRDVTDRKLGEQEREQLVARLRVQDQRKDEFLATLAHELRNPLAPIRNGLQIMRLAPGDAQATERIRAMMERQLGQMVHLIDDLLDLSRISRGKIDLRRERIELAKAIQQAIEASRPAIANAGHELLIKFPPGPIHVDADLTRLAQVFSNLLNNAAKFTDPGGRIQLTMQQLGDEAVASIQDNGSGIPTGMLPHVFEMFTQVEGNLERSKGGLGIGLSIVKRLVEMHGGSVQARSEGTGMGSEFVVRLPVALTLAADALADPPAPAYPDTSHRILVVDDNLDAAESLATMLAMMGNETRTAHDGLQALKVAAAFRPDVMFLDIGMPKMNGYEVGRRAREQAWGKDMVLIALTGWGQEEDKRRSMEAGLDLHLVKPVLPAALEKLLASLPSARA